VSGNRQEYVISHGIKQVWENNEKSSETQKNEIDPIFEKTATRIVDCNKSYSNKGVAF